MIDLSGQRFGRLTVVRKADNKNGRVAWLCVCDCGKETIVSSDKLRQGRTQSCGCLSVELTVARSTKHGMSHTRLFKIWTAMLERCEYTKSINYQNYGGRGVTVCPEWRESFETFRDWSLANGYAHNMSIDRLDVNGNYCPENCRWATRKEQANNKRNSRLIACNGEEHTLAQWGEKTGLSVSVIHQRLKRGWSTEKALTTPVKKEHR